MRKLFNIFDDRLYVLAALLVACFVAVLLLPSQSRASYPTYLLAITVVLSVGAWRDIVKVRLLQWVALLLLWFSASVFWSDEFSFRSAASIWVRALLLFCFVIGFAECQLRGQVQRWLLLSLTLAGAIAVIAAVSNFYLTSPIDGRLNGLGQLDTHVIAALVYGFVLICVLRLGLSESTAHLLRIASWLVVLIIVLAIFLSDSRNAWVSVGIGVSVFVFSYWVVDRQKFVALLSAVFLLGAVLLAVAATSDELGSLLFPRGDSFRLLIWSSTIERAMEGSLVFGQGVLTNDDIQGVGLIFDHPHNLYLSVLFQGGLVALSIFVGILLRTAQVLFRHYEHLDAKLALGVLALACSAYMLDGHELIDKVGDTWFLVWFPISVAIGLEWHKPQDKSVV